MRNPLGAVVWGAFAAAFRCARWLAYRDLEGRHYEHKGRPIDIVEDAAGWRWLRTDDVRDVIADLPRDALLRRLYPGGCNDDGRIEAETLLRHLAAAQGMAAVRFKVWLEREVVFPARRRRGGRVPA